MVGEVKGVDLMGVLAASRGAGERGGTAESREGQQGAQSGSHKILSSSQSEMERAACPLGRILAFGGLHPRENTSTRGSNNLTS